jgi:anti-sigma B factor antagonist
VSTKPDTKPGTGISHELSAPFGKGQNLDIEVRSQSEVKVIKLRGRLNLGESVDRMRDTFEDLMNAGETRLVIDLGEVSMIDSSGIGLLVRYLTAAKQRAGSVKLLNPSKFAVQTLRMTGLLKLFETFDDQQQAVSSFQ